MKYLQEKLDCLLEKYSVNSKAVLSDKTAVKIDGEEVPLLSYRQERRFTELKNLVQNGTLTGISVMRTARIVERGSDVFAELTREIDLCQFVLGRKIVSVMVMRNENTLNAIAVTEDSVVCTLEISATLKAGEVPKDKHEIIAQHGIACDIVVDAQLKQDSIYVFGDENSRYTDVDFELYGLSVEDIAVVRSAFLLAQKGGIAEQKKTVNNLNVIRAAAERSALSGKKEVL